MCGTSILEKIQILKFRQNELFCSKIPSFLEFCYENGLFWVQMIIFGRNGHFWTVLVQMISSGPKWVFLVQIVIFGLNGHFRPKWSFLVQMVLFDQNDQFWSKFLNRKFVFVEKYGISETNLI
jgi:hypothetical protein